MNTSPQATPGLQAKRWTLPLSRSALTMLVALWLMLSMNLPFWRAVVDGLGHLNQSSIFFLASLPVFVFIWLYLLLSLLAWGRLTKAVLGLVLLVSAAASYFINSFGIVIDHAMLTNVMQTDSAEALDLLTWRLLLWMFGLGLIPVLLLSRVRLLQRGWRRETLAKLGGMALLLLCMGGILMGLYKPYASLLRNHREVRLLLVPSNVVAAVHGYLKRELAAPHRLEVVGSDARRMRRVASGRPRVTLLVVGETARAANFSLNGYARPTNPELARRDVINFTQATSCGTATAVSVPCMFQGLGRDGYREDMAKGRENLLDVLQRAGVQVLWRDNNSGCKDVCDRVAYDDVSHLEVDGACADNECFDEILLHGLQDYLDRLERDAVIVLHMKGSHGPAYYKRYPPAFATFKPTCNHGQLDRCSRSSILNAYDNSLVYTDHVLAAAIDLLRHNAGRLDSAMLYLSDHGESLGENGVYLHGMPYALAPSEQIHIPMLMWFSTGLQQSAGVDTQCLRQRADELVSQDNLYHSVLGLMDVQTGVYRPENDLFRNCRSGSTQALTAVRGH
ncbi:phosphoethanolamine--lipid A transferase [Pseudomonas sp. CAU 1711]|uniref:phosphoethanolamine transferase n=1 Tax=Pseudomonas sp. CAU 1711 TaxID=3140356 RepID=UPI00326196B8